MQWLVWLPINHMAKSDCWSCMTICNTVKHVVGRQFDYGLVFVLPNNSFRIEFHYSSFGYILEAKLSLIATSQMSNVVECVIADNGFEVLNWFVRNAVASRGRWSIINYQGNLINKGIPPFLATDHLAPDQIA